MGYIAAILGACLGFTPFQTLTMFLIGGIFSILGDIEKKMK